MNDEWNGLVDVEADLRADGIEWRLENYSFHVLPLTTSLGYRSGKQAGLFKNELAAYS